MICFSIPYEDERRCLQCTKHFCISLGLPLSVVTYNAKEEYGGNWEMNKAEFEIRE